MTLTIAFSLRSRTSTVTPVPRLCCYDSLIFTDLTRMQFKFSSQFYSKWVREGLTSILTHYRSLWGQLLHARWPNQQCQSTEESQLVIEIRQTLHYVTMDKHKAAASNCIIRLSVRQNPTWRTCKLPRKMCNCLLHITITKMFYSSLYLLSSPKWPIKCRVGR